MAVLDKLASAGPELASRHTIAWGNWLDSLLGFLKPKPKIAIVSYYYPYKEATRSGVAIHVYNLAHSLAKLGCRVHVFYKGAKGRNKDGPVTVHGIEVKPPANADPTVAKRMEYMAFEHSVLQEILKENANGNFNMIHTHGWLTSGAFMAKKICNVPWVHTFHAVELNRIQYMSAEEKSFGDLASWIESNVQFADGLITVSKCLQKEVKSLYQIDSKVIPNGFKSDTFVPSPLRGKNVLFVGRFSKEKGINRLVDIIPPVLKAVPRSSFTIVASTSKMPKSMNRIRKQLDTLAKEYKGRVHLLTESISQEELAKLYKTCAVYIQPSRYEAFGLCILEAMATARPVIAFKVGGIPEVIGDAGIMISTTEDMIKNIIKLLKSPARSRKMGSNAADRAKEFDWSVIAKQTIKAYKSFTGGKIWQNTLQS